MCLADVLRLLQANGSIVVVQCVDAAYACQLIEHNNEASCSFLPNTCAPKTILALTAALTRHRQHFS